jgi:uncharacterized coiled-coil DUF342 family protein
MSKAKGPESRLVAAALAFDEQLAAYGRLAELLLKTPLESTKQLERVNQTIGEISAVEERLGATGRELAQAVGEARDQQQTLAERMVAHLPEVNRRNQELRDVVAELQQIGEVTQELNTATSSGTAAVLEVEERVKALAERAEALAVRARATGFDDVASQAHAVYQQLLAVARKLHTVTSRVS